MLIHLYNNFKMSNKNVLKNNNEMTKEQTISLI